jgi:hypothetical protein
MVDKRGRVSKEEVAALLVAGYAQAPILEVIVGIASNTMSNFINHLAGTKAKPRRPRLQDPGDFLPVDLAKAAHTGSNCHDRQRHY